MSRIDGLHATLEGGYTSKAAHRSAAKTVGKEQEGPFAIVDKDRLNNTDELRLTKLLMRCQSGEVDRPLSLILLQLIKSRLNVLSHTLACLQRTLRLNGISAPPNEEILQTLR
jgi:hypothetical protein